MGSPRQEDRQGGPDAGYGMASNLTVNTTVYSCECKHLVFTLLGASRVLYHESINLTFWLTITIVQKGKMLPWYV